MCCSVREGCQLLPVCFACALGFIGISLNFALDTDSKHCTHVIGNNNMNGVGTLSDSSSKQAGLQVSFNPSISISEFKGM